MRIFEDGGDEGDFGGRGDEGCGFVEEVGEVGDVLLFFCLWGGFWYHTGVDTIFATDLPML